MELITPELKDRILEMLITQERPDLDMNSTAEELGVKPSWIKLILQQFEELGLCKAVFFTGGYVRIKISADAHDMALRGGFTAREKYLKDSIEKLEREVKQLQAEFPSKAERFANILSGISSVVALLG